MLPGAGKCHPHVARSDQQPVPGASMLQGQGKVLSYVGMNIYYNHTVWGGVQKAASILARVQFVDRQWPRHGTVTHTALSMQGDNDISTFRCCSKHYIYYLTQSTNSPPGRFWENPHSMEEETEAQTWM